MTTNTDCAKTLFNVLKNHKASDLLGEQTIVEFDSSVTPIQAANILWAKDILGAPVWDDTKKAYVGFFDQRDILSAVTACAKESMRDGKEHTPEEFDIKMVDNLEMLHQTGAGQLTLTYLAARNPFHACDHDATLQEICTILTKYKNHRVPVVKDGRCVSIISQSALVKFLAAKATDLEVPLETSGMDYKKPVIQIKDTAPAHQAFDLLDSHRLSGIAVVDSEDGSLVGNTSARDIKLAARNKAGLAMDTDILTYLSAVRQKTPGNERYPACHVHESVSVGKVIRLLAKTGYHRVFVVDKDIKPVGVVSVADIVRYAIEKGCSASC